MSDARGLLPEPWSALERQTGAATFGVWVFIASELLFFGGLLLIYAVCRGNYPEGFSAAARETNIWYGTINTAVLLTSSLTMAMAAQAARADFRRLVILALVATALLGTAFAVLKGFQDWARLTFLHAAAPKLITRDDATIAAPMLPRPPRTSR